MKALTVQQPWAWAIIHGGKDVENRTQAWSYRGPLAIHAGTRWSDRGAESPLVRQAVWDFYGTESPLHEPRFCSSESPRQFAAFLGVIDLIGVHEAQPETHAFGSTYAAACCDSPWAEQTNHHAKRIVHLELANPRPITQPIPCRGRLGLWTPPPEILEQLEPAMTGRVR